MTLLDTIQTGLYSYVKDQIEENEMEITEENVEVYVHQYAMEQYETLHDLELLQANYSSNLEGLEMYLLAGVDGFIVDQLKDDLEEDEEPGIESMTINITEFGNAAMQDDQSGEVIRILQGIIKNIENYGVPNCNGMYLKDLNGNTIGSVDVIGNY